MPMVLALKSARHCHLRAVAELGAQLVGDEEDREGEEEPGDAEQEPGQDLTHDARLIDMLSAAIRDVTGRAAELSTSGGTSDARFIKDYCPVVEFGLVGQTMHQANERVAIADLLDLTRIYRRFLERYFAP